MPRMISALLALLLLLSGGLAAGCSNGGPALLSELTLSSSSISPTGRGDTPPIGISYFLGRPATISAYLESAGEERLYLRKNEYRPVAGPYELRFDGTYAPDPASMERRVLGPGEYDLLIEARDAAGREQQSRARLKVAEADTERPRIEKLTLIPEVISPNFDGVDDTTKISYRTTKAGTVSVTLSSDVGKRYILERMERQAPGEHATTWDGQVGNQLLPSGSYRLLVEAEDVAGNIAVAEKRLDLESSQVPDAHLMSVTIGPERVIFGDLLKVEMRVKNTGNTVLRSQGPDPGFVYDSQEGFTTVANGAYRDEKGFWRVGVDWASGPGASGSKYPYRWGFGKDLAPGEEATITGYIRVNHKYQRIWLYAGLIQEQVRYWDNEVGRTVIEIGY